jgi:hypothetical protein
MQQQQQQQQTRQRAGVMAVRLWVLQPLPQLRMAVVVARSTPAAAPVAAPQTPV